MADLNGFDASKVDPNAGFDCIPAGEYDACIVASEMKDTKTGGGRYLKLELQILSGQFQNRKLWDNLNLVNNGAKKEETEQIAKGTLSAICRAVNVLTPKDSSELHNKPLRIKVAVKRDTTYGDGNVIKGYMPRTTAPTVNPVHAMASSDPNWAAPQPTAQSAPWA